MYDSRLMRLREGVGNLRGRGQQIANAHAVAGSQLVQRLARDELHGKIIDSVVRANVVNRNDIGVVQRRGGLGLLTETLLAFGVRNLVRRKNLDRDDAIETRIARLVYLAHPARPDGRKNFVRPEFVGFG